MHPFAALGLNDLKSIRRDSLLAGVLTTPVLMVLFLRLLVPPLGQWARATHHVDLTFYHPLLLSLFVLINVPLLMGALTGFIVLDEREDRTLGALRVTPLSMTAYAAYRVGAAMALSLVFTLVCLPASGLLAPALAWACIPIAVVASLCAPVVALTLAVFAQNKLEGLAIVKALGILVAGPLAAAFVRSDWQLAFGIVPSYWPVKAFWCASAGDPYGPYLLAGTVYLGGALALLLRTFRLQIEPVGRAE